MTLKQWEEVEVAETPVSIVSVEQHKTVSSNESAVVVVLEEIVPLVQTVKSWYSLLSLVTSFLKHQKTFIAY